MSSQLDLLKQLKNQLVLFLDELIESFPRESDFVIFRIFVKDQIPTEDIMKYIANKLIPLKGLIKEKNEAFFLQNNILFGNFDNEKTSKVNHFRRLWQSDSVDANDKEVIWRWFSSFVYLADKYVECR